MLKASNITKYFGKHCAVNNISFEVRQGEVLGFLGPNGAGKSTTMRILTGYFQPDEGSVIVDEMDMAETPSKAKMHIGYSPENAPLYEDSTVEGFLKFIAAAKGLNGQNAKIAIDDAIFRCRLEPVRRQTIDTLSKGYRHRVCFAQAILNNPPILILDEPTDGLDPNQKQEMRELIRKMGQTKAIIVSTHILEEVDAICTRITIINHGKIVFNGTPSKLRSMSGDAGTIKIRFEKEPPQFAEYAKRLEAVKAITRTDAYILLHPNNEEQLTSLVHEIKTLCNRNNWDFIELFIEQGKLDDVFRKMTSH